MGEVGADSKLICVPGQRLCLSDENTIAGQGTYERHGYIYSMLAGVVVISEKEKVSPTNASKPKCSCQMIEILFILFAVENH